MTPNLPARHARLMRLRASIRVTLTPPLVRHRAALPADRGVR